MPTRPLTLECGRCKGAYSVTARNATAYLYVTDHRSNHVTATCGLCGHRETVFLAPEHIGVAIDGGSLKVRIAPDSDPAIRGRAAKAWEKARPRDPAPAASRLETPRDLTPRLESVVEQFAASLNTIPDDLLMDGFTSDHERPWPDRWTDG